MKSKEMDEFVLWYMKKQGFEKSAEKFSKARDIKQNDNKKTEKFEKMENRILGQKNEEKKVIKKEFVLDLDLSGPSATRRIDENIKVKVERTGSKVKKENKGGFRKKYLNLKKNNLNKYSK